MLVFICYNTGVSFFNISSQFVETFVTSDTEVRSVVRQWLGQQPASRSLHRAFRTLLNVDRWHKCLNGLGWYVEKWNTTRRRNINMLNFFTFFCCSYAVYHLSYNSKLTEKIIQIECVLLCTVRRHHREKLCICSELNSLQNVYFGFFLF